MIAEAADVPESRDVPDYGRQHEHHTRRSRISGVTGNASAVPHGREKRPTLPLWSPSPILQSREPAPATSVKSPVQGVKVRDDVFVRVGVRL